VRAVAALLALGLGASAARAEDAASAEGRKAREQARLCEREQGETGLAACRAALDLGLPPDRQAAVRELLARRLVELERWVELTDHYREGVRLDPGNAEAWFRLGTALLFAVDDAVEQVAIVRDDHERHAQLVELLCQGSSLDEAAVARGVTMNTARSQLKQVFAKTHTSRQSELVRLVMSGVASIAKP